MKLDIKNKSKEDILLLISERILYIKCTNISISRTLVDILWNFKSNTPLITNSYIFQSLDPKSYQCIVCSKLEQNIILDTELYDILVIKTLNDISFIENIDSIQVIEF